MKKRFIFISFQQEKEIACFTRRRLHQTCSGSLHLLLGLAFSTSKGKQSTEGKGKNKKATTEESLISSASITLYSLSSARREYQKGKSLSLSNRTYHLILGILGTRQRGVEQIWVNLSRVQCYLLAIGMRTLKALELGGSILTHNSLSSINLDRMNSF